MAYKGKAPLTLVRRQGGSVEYVYAKGLAPGDAVDGELERLADEGYLEQVDDPAEAEPESDGFPAGAPDDSWRVADLREFAAANGIDLGDAKGKDVYPTLAAALAARG